MNGKLDSLFLVFHHFSFFMIIIFFIYRQKKCHWYQFTDTVSAMYDDLLVIFVVVVPCVLIWLLSVTRCVKDFSQIWHLNGFSPVWIRKCVRRFENCENALPQYRQPNGLSPLCVRWWSRKWDDLPKLFSQYMHWKRRFWLVDFRPSSECFSLYLSTSSLFVISSSRNRHWEEGDKRVVSYLSPIVALLIASWSSRRPTFVVHRLCVDDISEYDSNCFLLRW